MEIVTTRQLGGYAATRFCNGNLRFTSLVNTAQTVFKRNETDWVLEAGSGYKMVFTVAWMDSLAEYLEKQPEGIEIILVYHRLAPKLIGEPEVVAHKHYSSEGRMTMDEIILQESDKRNLCFFRLSSSNWTGEWKNLAGHHSQEQNRLNQLFHETMHSKEK